MEGMTGAPVHETPQNHRRDVTEPRDWRGQQNPTAPAGVDRTKCKSAVKMSPIRVEVVPRIAKTQITSRLAAVKITKGWAEWNGEVINTD
jgi:hypothetical protein